MNAVSRSVSVALALCCGFLAVVVGVKLRDQRDLPGSTPKLTFESLLASRSKDIDIAEADYYREISELLKENYVDPITDDKKLLSGAVRGMIVSLKDSKSQFFNPKEFATFKKMRQGIYEGVGAYLAFEGKAPVSNQSESTEDAEEDLSVPRLTVVAITPNGPAAKAGVKPGDIVTSVDQHWVVNGEEILRFRKAQADFQQKKIDFKTINALRIDLRKKMDKSIMPVRVREKLITGLTGEVEVSWERNGKTFTTQLTKAASEMPPLTANGSTITLPFIAGSPENLASAIKGKPAITIDLRGNVLGDFETMRKCLDVLVPAGTYGQIKTVRNAKTPAKNVKVVVDKGNPKPPAIKLITDKSTRDAAEMFTIALTSTGRATATGEGTGNDRNIVEIVELPDGSGYTLSVGEFARAGNVVSTKGKGGAK